MAGIEKSVSLASASHPSLQVVPLDISQILPSPGPAAATLSATTPFSSVHSRGSKVSQKGGGGSRKQSSYAGGGSVKSQKATFYSVMVDGDDGGMEMHYACSMLKNGIDLRSKYKTCDKGQKEGSDKLTPPIALHVDDGVFNFSDERTTVVPWEQYYDDVTALMSIIHSPMCIVTVRYRLQVLEEKFNLYKLSNTEIEEHLDKYRRGGGVFADTTKVDNYVHLAYGTNCFSLLQFVQAALETNGDDVVRTVGDRKEPQTLRRLLEVVDLTDVGSLGVEGLGITPLSEDILDPELNKAGKASADLLRVFLTRDTANSGDFFADVMRPVLQKHDARSRYLEGTEYVLELHGYDEDEWEQLAKWFNDHQLSTDYSRLNRYIVAIHRSRAKKEENKDKFEFHQKHLDNIFIPLFLATLAPEDPKNSDLAKFLQCVGGFMISSDEEYRESDFTRKRRRPAEVPWGDNVCDLYFAYYVWANLCSLNAFRKRRGLNTLQLRALANERSSNLDTLLYSYLLADMVAHGLLLSEHPVLQYLYGINRIGIAMCPLSNNASKVSYMDSPFPSFFRRGLLVSLSTNKPLLYHHSPEPLQEEYGTAGKIYRLTGIDLCEIAHNSVMMSSFGDEHKGQWLGESYIAEGIRGNQIELSNVPTCRLELRLEQWNAEVTIIENTLNQMPIPRDVQLLQSKVPYIVSDPHVDYPRIIFFGPYDRDSTHSTVAQLILKALDLRLMYTRGKVQHDSSSPSSAGGAAGQQQQIEEAFKKDATFKEEEWEYKTVDGIVVAHEVHQIPRLPKDMHRWEDFRQHVMELRAITDNIHVRNFAQRRLALLERKFILHLAVNHSTEAGSTAERQSQNRDFYQATKVDNNVRMEAGMTARHLLNFIVSKASNNADDIVAQEEGEKPKTLRQLLQDLKIDPASLTVDNLNVQADTTLGIATQRFTPKAPDPLLTLLLKTDNQMKGRYYAELTKLTFENFKRDRFTFAENRLIIYGAHKNEWNLLSDWFDTHGMACHNNQWMVQIPRIYSYLRKEKLIQNFAQYLEHIFNPLWEVSLHPSSNPRLFHFVNHISGFDCVEDERKVDMPLGMSTRSPQEWTELEEPPYNYYLYHLWANIYSLNEFRQFRKFSTFSFRPSCGETGPVDHVAGGYLLANAINYGIKLKDDPAFQYLFYLAQIGIAVCPLSNNTKVLDYLENPFVSYFRRGLNVTLSTDGPLQFHHTQEPLLEEYSIASKVWKLSPNDLCEIARNSVLMSGFDAEFKRERLGKLFFLSSSKSNDTMKTHLSDIRVAYRYDTYHTEISLLEHVGGLKFPRAMLREQEENAKVKAIEDRDKLSHVQGPHGIIDSTQDEVDIQRMASQRQNMQRQLDEMLKSLAELQKQNRLLQDKLHDEVARDQQAQQLRRQEVEEATKKSEKKRQVREQFDSAFGAGNDSGMFERHASVLDGDDKDSNDSASSSNEDQNEAPTEHGPSGAAVVGTSNELDGTFSSIAGPIMQSMQTGGLDSSGPSSSNVAATAMQLASVATTLGTAAKRLSVSKSNAAFGGTKTAVTTQQLIEASEQLWSTSLAPANNITRAEAAVSSAPAGRRRGSTTIVGEGPPPAFTSSTAPLQPQAPPRRTSLSSAGVSNDPLARLLAATTADLVNVTRRTSNASAPPAGRRASLQTSR
jgi:AMP deaminase